MEKSYFTSSIGIFEIVSENNALISLKLVEKSENSSFETDFNKKVKTQLNEYFSGSRKVFDLKLNPQGTDFQKRVWLELSKIPFGELKSYSQIAQQIQNPNAVRAVGSACNKNPIMIIIPCHRVISKNGNLGGFAYGNLIKQKLLNLEHQSNF